MLIILIINISYLIFNLVLMVIWQKMIHTKIVNSSQKDTKLTIIVPVRNESANIFNLLTCLNRQNYPFKNFEVIIANDGSTDDTEDIVLNFQGSSKYELKLLNILNEKGSSPKKRAIQKSVEIAAGDLILTTDGDCIVSENWLSSVEQKFKTSGAKFISSPVTFSDEKSFWNTLQMIEFASLIGSGACAMFLKKPNMCNGANIAYTREVFEEVGGFAGNEHLASGDDEFLMHKISKLYPTKVVFNIDKNAIVYTKSSAYIIQFYQQRKRWASNWKHYKDWKITTLAIFIFTVNLTFLWSLFTINYLAVIIKLSAEFFYLSIIIGYFGYKNKVKFIPIIQF